MEAPPDSMSVDEFNAHIARERDERYEEIDGVFVCKDCGEKVQSVTCYVSEHAEEFGSSCAGRGGVQNIVLPFCPKCEGQPERTSTCVHMPVISGIITFT